MENSVHVGPSSGVPNHLSWETHFHCWWVCCKELPWLTTKPTQNITCQMVSWLEIAARIKPQNKSNPNFYLCNGSPPMINPNSKPNTSLSCEFEFIPVWDLKIIHCWIEYNFDALKLMVRWRDWSGFLPTYKSHHTNLMPLTPVIGMDQTGPAQSGTLFRKRNVIYNVGQLKMNFICMECLAIKILFS